MPKLITLFSAVFLIASFGQESFANEPKVGEVNTYDLNITGAWARAGKPNSAAFMKIASNTGADIKIISATTPVAPRVELHDHIHEGDVMKMRKVDAISIPSNNVVELMPGGKHVMLFDLGEGLKEGQVFKLTLILDNGAKVNVDVPVKPMTYNPKLAESGCGCGH